MKLATLAILAATVALPRPRWHRVPHPAVRPPAHPARRRRRRASRCRRRFEVRQPQCLRAADRQEQHHRLRCANSVRVIRAPRALRRSGWTRTRTRPRRRVRAVQCPGNVEGNVQLCAVAGRRAFPSSASASDKWCRRNAQDTCKLSSRKCVAANLYDFNTSLFSCHNTEM